jgi:hypothetical protein
VTDPQRWKQQADLVVAGLRGHTGGVGRARDAVWVLIEWRRYRELTRSPSAGSSRRSGCSTAANALDREALTAAGWTYRALGRRAG